MLISEGGKPRNNFLKGQTKNTSSIEGGVCVEEGGGGVIKLNGPRCHNSNFSCSIWTCTAVFLLPAFTVWARYLKVSDMSLSFH